MSELGTKKSGGLSRRDFLKLMGAAGTGLAFAPFVPFGNFMPNPNQASAGNSFSFGMMMESKKLGSSRISVTALYG